MLIKPVKTYSRKNGCYFSRMQAVMAFFCGDVATL